jgi:F-type H+-transporting ATPase subunit delta
MKETRVANRYAMSLLDLALEKNVVKDVNDDMTLVLKTIQESKDLQNLLNSPIINEGKKIAIFKELFHNKINALSGAFIEMLARKRRETNLAGIAEEFTKLYNEHRGVQRAIVTTAVGLDSKLRKEILELVKKQTSSEVELVERIDKSIIGGFTLQLGDTQIDSSIVRSLKRLRRDMGDNLYKQQ